MILSVPQKKESPIPANGPMSPTFTLLMISFVKVLAHWLPSPWLRNAVGIRIPYGVVLKIAIWRLRLPPVPLCLIETFNRRPHTHGEAQGLLPS